MLKQFVENVECHRVLCIVDSESDDAISHSLNPLADSDLTDAQQSELQSILSDFDHIFSDSPGHTTSASHSINVTQTTPLWSPNYSLPMAIESAFKQELDNLLECGIIVPSDSPWSFPPIPVRKKDGTIRIVVDYRRLNSITVPLPFTMPTPESIIAKLGSAKYLSKMDLCKGFHQVPMDPDSQDFTAFSCKWGKFAYQCVPFGLRNAPATFQVLMQRVFADYTEFVEPYIDDVVVFSSNWVEHLEHLSLVLQRLADHSLTVKPSKCKFGSTKFEFLGLVVGHGSLSIPESRVKQFKEYRRPITKKQMRYHLLDCVIIIHVSFLSFHHIHLFSILS